MDTTKTARRAAAMLIRNHRAFGVRVKRTGRPGYWWIYCGNGVYAGELSIRDGKLCKQPAGRHGRLHVLVDWMIRAANPAPYRMPAFGGIDIR